MPKGMYLGLFVIADRDRASAWRWQHAEFTAGWEFAHRATNQARALGI